MHMIKRTRGLTTLSSSRIKEGFLSAYAVANWSTKRATKHQNNTKTAPLLLKILNWYFIGEQRKGDLQATDRSSLTESIAASMLDIWCRVETPSIAICNSPKRTQLAALMPTAEFLNCHWNCLFCSQVNFQYSCNKHGWQHHGVNSVGWAGQLESQFLTQMWLA